MTVILVIVALLVFAAVQTLRIHRLSRSGDERAVVPVRAFSDIRLPQGLFLSDRHCWVRLTEQGDLRVGMDELLTQAVGVVERVDLPEVGARVEAGSPLATVWSGGRSFSLVSPVTGDVVTRNTAVERRGSGIEEDPYGTGWIATVWPAELQPALGRFLVGAKSVSWLRAETQRFCDFMAANSSAEELGAILADGAHPIVGAAQSLDDEAWSAFASAFANE